MLNVSNNFSSTIFLKLFYVWQCDSRDFFLINFADSLLSGGTEIDMTERACSEHISDQVNLKWTLTGTETSGVTSLRGISLSATMLGLMTVAPLEWSK